MKAVAITANPEVESLTQAVGSAFLDGAAESGALTDMIDLHAEAFNPVYSMEDRLHYLGQGPVPDDVAALQSRIEDADVIAFVFPMYWFSMPAIMKGFFDRVLCRGFSYNIDGTPGALAGKTIKLIILCGASEGSHRIDGVDKAIDVQICQRTLRDYCGVQDIEKVYLDGLNMGDQDEQVREEMRKRLIRISVLGSQTAVQTASQKPEVQS
ncbi:hypothetical protein KIMH_05540 [Bombiscardovia apis]|uniref:Flavodoxin-like fold domain-containing protein n=1 Tax=Bombiscardovia apis TaxID=2932182 RepID=A0ABM8BC32_9BIFI|nr:NAD(P)H-dependent oxidoreductase [Bombiscardovia apis]BDR54443.1 hypothetical protein KIMH_05540 [Bombiscardovia apis]